MGAPAIRVLICYQHSLLGLGLRELLEGRDWLDVQVADTTDQDALEAALAAGVDVIVFEEGGRVEPLDLFRRSGCELLVDVNIGTPDSWSIRRSAIRTTPDRLMELLSDAYARRAPRRVGAARAPAPATTG